VLLVLLLNKVRYVVKTSFAVDGMIRREVAVLSPGCPPLYLTEFLPVFPVLADPDACP
jgi:hypothetical protein